MVNTVDFILDCEVFSDLHFLKVPRKACKPQILYCVKPKNLAGASQWALSGIDCTPSGEKLGTGG